MRKRSRNVIALLLTFILCFSEIGSLAVQAADGPVVDLGDDGDDDGLVSEEGPDNDAVVSDQTDEETESVVQPDEGTDKDVPVDEGEDTQAADVTRLMVWEMLINAFHFSCAVEEYPDNYFNDISGSESYIDTIMLATVMGLTDVEAGQDLVPEGAATREFAACMMQQTVGRKATSESYTFSDTDDVRNKDAVQAAIDSGWFSLVDGKFIPQQAVTAAEFAVLKKAAEDAYADRQMDSSLATKYTLKAGVKDLGEKKTRFSMEDSVLTIVDDSSTGLSKGDIFVVLSDGIPDAYKAESVTISEGNTVVKVSYPEYDDVYEDLQVHQTESLDLRLAQLANPDGGAVISYLVGGTEAEGYEDGEEIYDLSEVGNRDVNALVVGLYAQKIPDITPSKKFDIATVWLKITNLYVEREKKTNEDKAVIYGDIEFGVSIDVDFDALGDYVLKDMQEALTLNITDPVTGCAYFSISPDMYIKGKLSLIKTGKFNCGIIHRMFGGDDVWLDYTNKDLDAVMDLTARFGIKVAVGVKLWIIPFAELYAEIGASIECKITRHRSNGMVCTDLQAWVYATKGFKLFGQDIEGPEDVLDYYTSPCRISRHYENGVEVDRCNYDAEDAEKEGTNPNVRKGRYYTPGNSRFGSGGLSKRTGSNGEVYNLFEYTLDKKTEEATITSYNGNATSLIIPSSLDGHKVVAIGSSVFKGKTQFVSVIIPSSITSIGNYAFQNCSNLKSVSLSSGLETLGYGVFENCKSLTEITIPKSLTSAGRYNDEHGVFRGTSLKTVSFEEGVTEIPCCLFALCNSLEEIEIPNTVTVIENDAFYKAEGLKKIKLSSNLQRIEGENFTNSGAFNGCKSLTTIELPESLEKIGYTAFANCISLESIVIPDHVTQIQNYAFMNCKKLSSVKLSKSLSTVGYGCFENCESLTEITIPKSLTSAAKYNDRRGVFEGTSLKKVSFEEGVTEIPECLFALCDSLEEIEIPDTVTVIENNAFYKAEGLKRVKLSSNLQRIEGENFTNCGAFNGCKSLTTIELPESLEKIGYTTFAYCISLESIVIPSKVKVINNFSFMNCYKLRSVILPESLTGLYSKAFYGCESLSEIVIPSKVSQIGEYVFYGNTMLEKVSVNSSVPVTIASYAFQNCTSLKNVAFSNYVTSIGSYCFDGDSELTEVNLGMGITKIPQNAFSNCNTLESIIIPYYVTSIGKNAFANDPKLTSITVLPTVTSIDSTAFSYTDSRLTMYGVKGSYAETFCTNNPGKAVFAEKSVNATKVEFDTDSISIPSGSSIVPPLTIEPADCTDTITWVSADESIVKVTNGLAKGVKAGTTKLTVTVADPVTGVGKKASINVTVTQGVTGITLNKTKLELDGGEVYKLVATVKPTNADDKRIAWESSDQDIATVDEEGNVTAIGKGSCTITVTALDGSEKTATCSVTVKTNLIVASSVADLQSEHPYPINASDIWMYKDERMNGMVVSFSEETMLEADSTDCIVIMDASRKQVGKYSADQLSGKSVDVPGNTVYIQLISDGFQSGDYGFAVTDIRAKGTASPTPTPTKTVTPTPTPTGGANPTPTPTGGAKPTPTGGANPTPTPTPGPDGPDPYVDAPAIQLAAKAKYNVAELMAPQIPEGKQIAKYKVDSKKIASVSKKGILTAKKAGTVIVTAFEKTGKKSYEPIAYATVTVVKPEFKFINKDLTYTGATVDANDFISNLPEGATISWSVPPKKTAIATVDSSSGVITAGDKNGTVKVSCEISEGGYSVKYSADIKVKIPKPAATLNIKDGKTKKLTLKNVSKYTEVEWSSPSQAIIIQSTSKNYIVKLTALSTLDPEAAAAPIPITAVVDGKEYVTYVTIKQ